LSNQSFAFEQKNDVVNNAMHILFTAINDQIWLLWHLIRIVDTRKSLDLTPSSSLVNPFPIGLFLLQSASQREQRAYAVFEGSRNMNEIETPILLDLFASKLSSIFEWGNRSGDDSGASTREFRTHKSYSCNILVPVLT
jgi:hypothetical protein